VIVVDTSAWIELFRATESPAHLRLRRAIAGEEEIAVTEVVVAEVLAGATRERQVAMWRDLLFGFPLLRLEGLIDFEAAAGLARMCRAAGEGVRGIPDCLVAIPAISVGAAVLHQDRDFDVLARHTPLQVVALDD